MLRRDRFWQEEKEAPIFRLNCGFLPSNDILQRIPTDNEDDLITEFDHVRIIRMDAERTFLGSAQRSTLMHVLSFLRHEFKSYHQAMSYVAGFLLLIHSPSKVIEQMRQLHHHVLVGYWTEEPVAFATDAYVFDYLLADHFPDVHQHLSKHHLLPETYAQKWFTTLCVAVLPFQALFLFFDTFVAHALQTSSNRFLFQFALSLIQHVREGILKANNVANIYAYLRLDPSLPHTNSNNTELAMAIVRDAKDYDLSHYDFVLLRQKAYDEKLRARLEAAKRAHEQNQHPSSSSETSSEDEDEDEERFQSNMNTLVTHMQQMNIHSN